MNCKKILKLIQKQSSGGISSAEKSMILEHCNNCPDCESILIQDQLLTTGLKDLDYSQFRNDSLNAFGRLAVTVRSYRSPKASFMDFMQVKPLRLATVSALLIVFVVALSNLNFSYSYTNGANLKLTFDPPLKKSENIHDNQFHSRLNNDLNLIAKVPSEPAHVSWAMQIEPDSLKAISIDIQTDNPSQITDVFDSLLDIHPVFVNGNIYLSPLKNQINTSAFKAMTRRKPDSFNEYDLKTTVLNDLLLIIQKVDQNNIDLSSKSEKLDFIISQHMPEIRQLSSNAIRLSRQSSNSGRLTAITVDPHDIHNTVSPHSVQNSFKEQVYELIEKNADSTFNENELDQLLNIEVFDNKASISLGSKDILFSPLSSGGNQYTIIRDSRRHFELNGIDNIVKSHELDDLINGKLQPVTLQKTITERLDDSNHNETISIEIWQGNKVAELNIHNNDPKVIMLAPPIPSNINLALPTDPYLREIFLESEEYQQIMEHSNSEREIVFKRFDNSTRKHAKVYDPWFSPKNSSLTEWVTDAEIINLINGSITPKDLENIIKEKIRFLDNPAIEEGDIMMIRDGINVTIHISQNEVTVNMSKNSEFPSLGDGAIVIKHPDKNGSGVR